MSYNIYKIRLTPITPYFFGKENISDLGNKNDYFQTSNEYPQQTTLLGLLRHKVLRENNVNLDHYNYQRPNGINEERLIGEHSFKVNNNILNNYGYIHSISPCFIIDENDEILLDRSNEYRIENNVKESLCLSAGKNSFVWEKSKEPYIAKHQFNKQLIHTSKKDCFHTANYTGIYKGGIGVRSKEESYFIMEYQHLLKKTKVTQDGKFAKNSPLSFGFFACIHEDFSIDKQNLDFIPMGKEQSLFKVVLEQINCTPVENDNTTFYDFKPHLCLNDACGADILKCILLSDAYLDIKAINELETHCILQIVNKQRFRFIKSTTQRFNKGAKPIKSAKAYNMLAKGSVLYIDKNKKEEIEKLFNQFADFKQIGYNYITFKNAKTQ